MHVTLCDVGPRDGLQNDAVRLAPEMRAELCDRLAATGLQRIECVSFVSPKLVPQMAGAEDVFAGLHRVEGVVYAALALNGRGVERAVAAGADEVHLAYPLSDTFCARNQNTTLAAAAASHVEMIAAAHRAGVRASVTLGASFGCPFEGPVPEARVLDHVERMAAAGADEILLADTIGVGVPSQVRSLVPAALRVAGGIAIGLHLHNTRNTGYANAAAGIEAGATIFDASIGGLGGCPFAPRATGNIATEDLVYLLDGLGVETGVDLNALITVSEWLAGVLGRELPGQLYKAGPFLPTG
jgi:hydroxymethylglutaryl-CoA lyase/(R)-citramalyl-CoA lyase